MHVGHLYIIHSSAPFLSFFFLSINPFIPIHLPTSIHTLPLTTYVAVHHLYIHTGQPIALSIHIHPFICPDSSIPHSSTLLPFYLLNRATIHHPFTSITYPSIIHPPICLYHLSIFLYIHPCKFHNTCLWLCNSFWQGNNNQRINLFTLFPCPVSRQLPVCWQMALHRYNWIEQCILPSDRSVQNLIFTE